mmetsp:Transcript_8476/g.20737  ORF Transcript_8476/g.20737 Transcript_8476/m.20737 type:complete len:332 (+) Transcript_8476:220-1215(+)|eukprot:CAMPEP_0181128916 /NCGR_PEP_ID=MMETSP1071-20121207/29032_1 /TAXON_ID=35127 /ORGANISM="Thalassiosira sp., Strain NH16" /LENGTH=331 /DNA_ID=CAMNT_0023214845 /DNA_START=139 /DNA_END=1134 /DNA_ORIENTATION=+
MGNCLKHSSSAAAAQNDTKPAEVLKSSCDERTADAESTSNTTISPPASPVKPDVYEVEIKQGESINVVCQPAVSPLKVEVGGRSSPTMEQQRDEGQRRLRELVVSGANAGDIDWKAIIALAEDLHRKEQHLLRSYNEQRLGNKLAISSAGCSSENVSCRHNISRRQAFFEKRRRRREKSRRRKLESVGSFSVNLSMYQADERCQQEDSPSIAEYDFLSFSSSGETAIDESEELDVFEDDDPSPLHQDPLCPTLPCQQRRGTERPGTPSPVVKSIPDTATEGSFMAATSLFDSAKDYNSSSSSSSDSSISGASEGESWDLMTIDEDATVTKW